MFACRPDSLAIKVETGPVTIPGEGASQESYADSGISSLSSDGSTEVPEGPRSISPENIYSQYGPHSPNNPTVVPTHVDSYLPDYDQSRNFPSSDASSDQTLVPDNWSVRSEISEAPSSHIFNSGFSISCNAHPSFNAGVSYNPGFNVTGSNGPLPELLIPRLTISDYSPLPLNKFPNCPRHELSRAYFCRDCGVDGCPSCMLSQHKAHKYSPTMTCEELINREQHVHKQMQKCLDNLSMVWTRMSNFKATLVQAVKCWQQTNGTKMHLITKIERNYYQQIQSLHGVRIEADLELQAYRQIMRKLKRTCLREDVGTVLICANQARRSIFKLEDINAQANQSISNAILLEKDGCNSLSEVIKVSGMEVLTREPLSRLENLIKPPGRQTTPPIFDSTPDLLAPEIPPVLVPLFNGHSVPSPTISNSFTFAAMDPIAPRPSRCWPAPVDQMQMESLHAISRLLKPMPPPEVHFDQRSLPSTPMWQPCTPQPQATFDPLAKVPQRASSLVDLWEGSELQGPKMPQPLVPLPQLGDPFDIGYHIARNYSQVKSPVVKIEGRNVGDPSMLCRPWGICSDKKNLLYVADRSNNRIAVFRTDGSFVRAFGGYGEGPGELNRPAGLTIDSQGRLIVADKDNHRIQVFSTEGEYLFHFGKHGNQHGEFFYPWDVACDSEDRIAVSDSRNHRVQLFSSSGVYIRKYGWESRPSMLKELDQPRGMLFVKDHFLMTDFNNHRIIKLKFGERVTTGPFNETHNPRATLERPQGLAEDSEGNILVCDSRNHRIVVFSPEGKYISDFGRQGREDGQFERSVDVAVAADGKVAVVDLGNNRVQIF